MRSIALAALIVSTLIATVADANAVVCAKGVYRAGCAGPRGAAVVHRPPVHCYYRYGRRVCVR
jgi:hypothetical protein